GTYEMEHHAVVEQIATRNYPLIVDVGAAEGYFAVGLALRCSSSQVISYDVDPIARVRQRQLAKLNAIENLEIQRYCTHEELTAQLGESAAFIVCDVEGYEMELLDPSACPALKNCDMLVEIHPYYEQS